MQAAHFSSFGGKTSCTGKVEMSHHPSGNNHWDNLFEDDEGGEGEDAEDEVWQQPNYATLSIIASCVLKELLNMTPTELRRSLLAGSQAYFPPSLPAISLLDE